MTTWDRASFAKFALDAPSVSLGVGYGALFGIGSIAGDPLHQAAEHLGRLLRTVFLCDYIAIEDFRREIHTLLNQGDSVHRFTSRSALSIPASRARVRPPP